MPATQRFTPSEPTIPKTFTDDVTIPAPLQKDPPQKTPIMQKILQIGMPVIMVTMMIIMFRVMGNGGARQIMMMMMMGLSLIHI